MILIVKNQGKEEYTILRLAKRAQYSGCRINNALKQEQCFDEIINRKEFYGAVIINLTQRGFDIAQFEREKITNYHHDLIVQFMERKKLTIIQAEVSPKIFKQFTIFDELDNLDL